MKCAACLLVGLALVCACLGQPRAMTKPEQVRMLSDVMPDALRDYVLRTGGDRALSPENAEAIQAYFAGEGRLRTRTLIDILEPTAYKRVVPPLTLLGEVRPEAAEGAPDQLEPVILALSTVVMENDEELPAGTKLMVGDVVRQGLVLNAGEVVIRIESGNGQVVTLGPGEIMATKCHSCSTTCGQGFYACCSSDRNGCCHCTCVQNGNQANCNVGGGPGAVSCSCGELEQLP